MIETGALIKRRGTVGNSEKATLNKGILAMIERTLIKRRGTVGDSKK